MKKSSKAIIPIIVIPICISIIAIAFSSINLEETENDGGEWNKTFMGHKARCVAQTRDGGYIITGYTFIKTGDFDSWLVKTDANGNEEWNKTFGGKKEDNVYSVIETDDGYIIAGYTFSYGAGKADTWLIKTDANGNEEWNKTFGGKNTEFGKSAIQTNDGGYAIGGLTYSYGAGDSDFWLIKTDSTGNEEWNRTFGGKDSESGEDVIQTNDNGYAITGRTSSYGSGRWDVWLIKTNTSGNEEWNRTFGGWSFDRGMCLIQTNDGGYAITGDSESYNPKEMPDVLLIKTDSNGNMEWGNIFGGIDTDSGRSLIQTNGGYLIAGYTWSYDAGKLDAWLIKTDQNGNEEWNKTFGGRNRDAAYCIIRSGDGSYVIAGETEGHAWLIKCQDYAPPKIKIIRPKEGYLYIFDREIIPTGRTIILGGITIEVEPYDPEERIDKVEFYIDTPEAYGEEPRVVDYEPPYEWTWDEPVVGPWLITAVAYYGNAGSNTTDKIDLWIFNL